MYLIFVLSFVLSFAMKQLQSAEQMAEKTVIGSESVIYTTQKDLSDQDYEAAEWKRRLMANKE